MPKQNWKRPNAYKHGIFSATAILPGEDEQEFERLHADLIEEWKPVGTTEEDTVLTIAKAVWRKRRVQRFLEVQLRSNVLDPDHPSYIEVAGLRGLAGSMILEPETGFDKYARRFLWPERIEYFREKFPRSNYKSTVEWTKAILDEIKSLVALPPDLGPEHQNLVSLHHTAQALSADLFKQELALDERLDAMIDRAVKRLIQMKAMKQMLQQTSSETTTGQLKRISKNERS
jgi:hypothetical protein